MSSPLVAFPHIALNKFGPLLQIQLFTPSLTPSTRVRDAELLSPVSNTDRVVSPVSPVIMTLTHVRYDKYFNKHSIPTSGNVEEVSTKLYLL